MRLLCRIVGHRATIANEVWDKTWRRWTPIGPDHHVVICSRCGRNLNGWGLRYRAVAK